VKPVGAIANAVEHASAKQIAASHLLADEANRDRLLGFGQAFVIDCCAFGVALMAVVRPERRFRTPACDSSNGISAQGDLSQAEPPRRAHFFRCLLVRMKVMAHTRQRIVRRCIHYISLYCHTQVFQGLIGLILVGQGSFHAEQRLPANGSISYARWKCINASPSFPRSTANRRASVTLDQRFSWCGTGLSPQSPPVARGGKGLPGCRSTLAVGQAPDLCRTRYAPH